MLARPLRSIPEPWRHPLLYGAAIVAGWSLMALIWTPPSILVARAEHETSHWTAIFLRVFLAFVPWMLVTPVLLHIGQRFPVAEGRPVRKLAIHIGIGVVLVPLLAVSGQLLTALVLPLPQDITLMQMFGGAMITGLYSAPTYIAVVGIGQALAYLQRYRRRERLLAQAQLRALQAQIHPHFLFNTLNAISALGYDDPARADRALGELSALLRLALKEGPEEIPLGEEIAFVQACIDIYALLMPERLACEIEVDGAAWNALVPRMILQPLVENAIVHGITRRRDGGAIALSARIEGGRLVVSLENDNADIPQQRVGNGIGLGNVRERLRVLYGEEQMLDLRLRDGGRTRVTMALPFTPGRAEA